jgi:hypothetical protein
METSNWGIPGVRVIVLGLMLRKPRRLGLLSSSVVRPGAASPLLCLEAMGRAGPLGEHQFTALVSRLASRYDRASRPGWLGPELLADSDVPGRRGNMTFIGRCPTSRLALPSQAPLLSKTSNVPRRFSMSAKQKPTSCSFYASRQRGSVRGSPRCAKATHPISTLFFQKQLPDYN